MKNVNNFFRYKEKTMDIKSFFLDEEQTMAPWKEHKVTIRDRRYWHIKSGGKILLIAHIDTVLKPTMPKIKKKRIKAKGLDDRLGVYMAMNILTAIPEIVDVLITDDEEIEKIELETSFKTRLNFFPNINYL